MNRKAFLGAIATPRSTLDPDARRYFAACRATGATITPGFATAVNTLVVGLKADVLWAPLSVINLMRNETEACVRINLKQPGYSNLVVAAGMSVPTFTQYDGCTGGTNLGYTTGLANSALVTVNNQGIFYSNRVAGTLANPSVGILHSTGSFRTVLSNPRDASGKVVGRIGAATSTTSTASVANRTGYRSVMRPSSGAQRQYENAGAFIAPEGAVASTSASAVGISLFVSGSTGAASFADDTMSIFGVSTNLSDADNIALAARIAAFDAAMDAL